MRKRRNLTLVMAAVVMVASLLVIPFLAQSSEAMVNEGVLMYVPNVTASPGAEVSMDFELRGALTGFTIDITYDADALTFKSFNNTTPLTFYVNTGNEGVITVVWFDAQDHTFSGSIAKVVFTINGNASGDYDIVMTCDDASWSNGAMEGTLDPAVGTLSVTAGTVLKVSSASGEVGDTVIIEINIENNPGIAGTVLLVIFDSDVLEVISAEAGTVTSNGLFFANTENPGKITMSWLLLNGVDGDGSLLEITFKIKDTAEKSTEISVVDNGTSSKAEELISTTAVSGSVTIRSGSAPLWTWIIGMVAAIALVAVLTAWFWSSRKNRKG